MIAVGCLFVILVIMLFMVESYILMLLWNWLIPLFWINAPISDFFKCKGVIVLINIIGSIVRSAFTRNKE